jgi:hypothetical protein
MQSKPTILFFSIFSFVLLFACKNDKTADTNTPEAISSPTYQYPSLGNQDISMLYAQAEKVDIIFYELPISVNQDDAASAKNSVLYVSPAPVEINAACKPMGRLSWLSNGMIVREADFYADSTCHYFLFMQNNQPVAANDMSEAGYQFFKNIVTQVQQRTK